MKITQIMLAKGFGGAERHFVDLARELSARGITVQAICHEQFTGRRVLDNIDRISVTAIPVYGPWDKLASWRIARALAAFAPDAVHVHLARAAHLGGRAAHRLAIPVAANAHNFIKLKYYREVDHFTVPTTRLVRYLHELGIADHRTTFIPHFSAVRPRRPHVTQATTRFGAIGRFVAKKGFSVLLAALHQMRAAGVSATLSIAGDGPERAALEGQVDSLGLANHVHFAGWLDDPDELLNNTDVFVLPSLAEPFGIVVLEAMAAGLPIVTTRTDGPLEILDESCAYFADIGARGSLAAAMTAAANDRDGRAQKARRALERFTATYTPDVAIPKFIDLYAQLSASRQR